MQVVGLEAVTKLVKASGEIILNVQRAKFIRVSACIHQSFGEFIAIILRGVRTTDLISNRVKKRRDISRGILCEFSNSIKLKPWIFFNVNQV